MSGQGQTMPSARNFLGNSAVVLHDVLGWVREKAIHYNYLLISLLIMLLLPAALLVDGNSLPSDEVD